MFSTIELEGTLGQGGCSAHHSSVFSLELLLRRRLRLPPRLIQSEAQAGVPGLRVRVEVGDTASSLRPKAVQPQPISI